MKLLNYKKLLLSIGFMVVSIGFCYSQQGTVTVNQDKRINTLLKLKKENNESDNGSEYYKIQIYSGNRTSAEKHLSEFRNKIGKWPSKLEYETPNFKVWIGKFNKRLEADRALKHIRRKFPNAFIPKKVKR